MSKDSRAEQKELIIAYYAKTPIYKYAAMAGGITDETLKAWRDEDSTFSHKLNLARAKWVEKTVPKAKAEFLLERLERETFAPPKLGLEVDGGENPIRVLLDAYGITEGMDDGGKHDEPISSSSPSST